MTEDALANALEEMTAATAAMYNGDPGPIINSWAASDDITLFGAGGPSEKGHKPVTDTMHWVGSRFTGADAVEVEHTVIASSGDLAYTVGFERSHVSVDGGRRATWRSGSPISTGASTATGSSCTGTPTSRLRISGLPPCPALSRKTCERLGILIPPSALPMRVRPLLRIKGRATCPIRGSVRDCHGHSRTDRRACRHGFQHVALVAETSLIKKRSVDRVSPGSRSLSCQ
jgi:ketosteroid isomerase-like protein